MKILIIGSYPPPIGGNTVHIQRLMTLLQNAGHHVRILDYLSPIQNKAQNVITLPPSVVYKLLPILRLARQTSTDTLVHFHVSAMGRFKWFAPFLCMLFWRNRKLITIHSGSFITNMDHPLFRFYLVFILRLFDCVITVSAEQN